MITEVCHDSWLQMCSHLHRRLNYYYVYISYCCFLVLLVHPVVHWPMTSTTQYQPSLLGVSKAEYVSQYVCPKHCISSVMLGRQAEIIHISVGVCGDIKYKPSFPPT